MNSTIMRGTYVPAYREIAGSTPLTNLRVNKIIKQLNRGWLTHLEVQVHSNGLSDLKTQKQMSVSQSEYNHTHHAAVLQSLNPTSSNHTAEFAYTYRKSQFRLWRHLLELQLERSKSAKRKLNRLWVAAGRTKEDRWLSTVNYSSTWTNIPVEVNSAISARARRHCNGVPASQVQQLSKVIQKIWIGAGWRTSNYGP